MATTAPDRDRPNVVALPPLIYLGFLVLGLLVDLIWPTSIASLSVRLAVGGLLFAVGLVLAVSAVRRFARAGTAVEVYRPATALVSEGPYRFSRNPIYLGMTLGYAGLAVMGNSLWALALLIPTLVVIRYGVIAREEEYLERKFGEAYRRYRSAVRRWL
jgi:protein-S-isoprenylcysteine O-methyltransferase Ste14